MMTSPKSYQDVGAGTASGVTPAENASRRLKDAIVAEMVEARDIEVPQDLVDAEARMMAIELYQELKYASMLSAGEPGFLPDEMADRMEEIRQEAFRTVKTRLVLRDIIETESLEVTQEELEAEAMAISVRQQMPIEMVKGFLGDDLRMLRDDLLVRKALDSVCSNTAGK